MSVTSDSWLVSGSASENVESGSGADLSEEEEEWQPADDSEPIVVSDGDDDSIAPDTACQECHKTDNEAEMLICDDCGEGYHIGCIGMPAVPDREVWLCPVCTAGNVEVLASAVRGVSGGPATRGTATAAAAMAAARKARAALQAAGMNGLIPTAVNAALDGGPGAANPPSQAPAPAPAPAAAATAAAAAAAPPLKRGRGRPRKSSEARADELAERIDVVTVSITVAMQTGNLPAATFEALCDWVTQQPSGGMALERGGIYGHEHAQGVAKVLASTPQAVNKMLKDHLGWTRQAPAGAVVCVKKLTGRGLHTYHGILGYIMKDEGQAHYKIRLHNVSEEDIEQGKDQYLKHGAGALKKRTVLTPNSIFAKAALFFQMHARDDRNTVSFQHILLEMLHSGKYYPGAMWVIPYQGRGMSHERAQALWRMYVAPSTVDPVHVHRVFFHNGEQPEWVPNQGRIWAPTPEQWVQELVEKYFGEAGAPARLGVDTSLLAVDAGDGRGMSAAELSMGPPRRRNGDIQEYWNVTQAKLASLQGTAMSSKDSEEVGAALAALTHLLEDNDGTAETIDSDEDADFVLDRVGADA